MIKEKLNDVIIKFKCKHCKREIEISAEDLMNAGTEGPPYCDCTKDYDDYDIISVEILKIKDTNHKIIIDRCGQTCPFFESDDRINNKNSRCFLDPTITTWRYGIKTQEKGMMPKNCPMKRRKQIIIKYKEN